MNTRNRGWLKTVALLAAAIFVGTWAPAQQTPGGPEQTLLALEGSESAAPDLQDVQGLWAATGYRPTAEGRRVPMETTARIVAAGDVLTVYMDDKTLTGNYHGGHLNARYETSIPETGRSGKGRTHVAQVWEMYVVATGPDRFEGRISVTHSGFQASEAAKNGVQTAPLILTRGGDELARMKDADTARHEPAGSGYAFIAWEYAESSKSDVEVLINCDALGLNKVARRGERGLVKADAGDYRLLIRDVASTPPNWSDQILTLYVAPMNDLSVIISTNGPSDDRAAVVRVLDGGNEVVREYLAAN